MIQQALREFHKLESVDADPYRMNTLADLVFIAQFEIDLVEEGESEIDVRPHRAFVRKWSKPKVATTPGPEIEATEAQDDDLNSGDYDYMNRD